MRIGILAIGMSILIAASAVVMVASAAQEKTATYDEKNDVLTFVGLEVGDTIGIKLTKNQYQWQHNYTYENNLRFTVQILGDETLIPLHFVDDSLVVVPGEYQARACINNDEIPIDISIEE